MYAISFDLQVSALVQYYGMPYNKAYYDVRKLLQADGFEWIQDSTYMTRDNDMAKLVKAIMDLSKVVWFKKSVRDIRGFKVEDWSDFTALVKNE